VAALILPAPHLPDPLLLLPKELAHLLPRPLLSLLLLPVLFLRAIHQVYLLVDSGAEEIMAERYAQDGNSVVGQMGLIPPPVLCCVLKLHHLLTKICV
jgi:hypothetical protein